jgi:hypothetical protein
MMRPVLVFVVVAIAALVVASLLPAGGESAPSVQEDAVQELADKYAPIVHRPSHGGDCGDDGQPYEPAPVEMLFGQPEIVLKDGNNAVVAEGIDASDLFEKGTDFYIDLPGNPKNPGCTYEADYARFRGDEPGLAYARIARQEDEDGFALQYWFYYYFNDWNNKHESDWEMVQLIFDVATPEEALLTQPTETGYSQHSGGESADWDSDKVRKDGDHPHAYAATGAHSNFYRDRTFLGRAEQGAGFGCDDASGPTRAVPVEARVIPDDISAADDPFAWATYEGRWGERASGEFNGPTGPNDKRAWDEPFGWQDDLRETSVEVPISRDLEVGLNVADMFCGIVAFASNNLLVAFMSSPWIFLAGGLVVLGGAGATVARTRFWPAIPEPLRQTRHFGQIMSCAARIYARHPLTLLAIGLVFVPAAIIASMLQLALALVPFTGPIYDIFMRSTLSQLAVVLGVGSFFIVIAFSIVTAGVACVLDDLDRGGRPSTAGAYRGIWRRLKDLFFGRLRADVIITLLGVTIVGLPFAINRLVRWAFVEWGVIIEDKSGRDALAASAETVRGHWWRTLGVAAVVVGIGLGTAPVLGLAMLLFTDWPLSTVNGVSSVLFLALVPWTAVALTLLYYDLKARKGEASRADAGER